MKNKKTRSAVSEETLANLISPGEILLTYAVYLLLFGKQPKKKLCINEQP